MRYLRGEMAEGIADLTKAVEIACPLGNYRLLSTIMTWRGCAHLEAGMVDKALQDFLEGQEYARTIERTFESAVLSYYSGVCHLDLGQLKEAETCIQEVVKTGESYQGFLGSALKRLGNTGLALILARSGDLPSSATAFGRGLDGSGKDMLFFASLEARLRLEYSDVLFKLGQKEKAIDELNRAKDLFITLGNEKRASETVRRMN